MHLPKTILSSLIALLLNTTVCGAAEKFVSFDKGDWQLNAGSKVTIYVSNDDERGVERAVEDA